MRVTVCAILVALVLSVPVAVAKPSESDVEIELRLTGSATQTNGGPNPDFTFFLNVTGTGTKKTPNGNGVQIHDKNGLEGHLTVFDADGEQVVNYTVTVKFHAQQASAIAQGLPSGNFKFNLELTGKERKGATINNASTDQRVLSMNAHGDTSGDPITDDDDNEFFAVSGKGQSTTKPQSQGPARHFNLDLAGQGRVS